MRLPRNVVTAALWIVVATFVVALAAAAAEVAPSAEEIRPILLGTQVPEVSVKTIDGESFDLAAAVRSKRTLLIFYRGGW